MNQMSIILAYLKVRLILNKEHEHEFILDQDGQISCSICHVRDDEME
jgi:hypothetical protein